jgi:hypothetical protein
MEGLLLSTETPECPKCKAPMEYVEDIVRDGNTFKTYTCFKCVTFKLKKA